MTSQDIIESVVGKRVVSRFRNLSGIVSAYEPLGEGMCDILVDSGAGSCWYSSHEFKYADGSPLPDRKLVRRLRDEETLLELEQLLNQHIEQFNTRWPGVEFGKAHYGNMLVNSIEEVKRRIRAKQ